MKIFLLMPSTVCFTIDIKKSLLKLGFNYTAALFLHTQTNSVNNMEHANEKQLALA